MQLPPAISKSGAGGIGTFQDNVVVGITREGRVRKEATAAFQESPYSLFAGGREDFGFQ